ncbi:MAG: molecular chaperone GrpE [Thermoleophilaceae bacterium]|jgi:molecular chaperone GrpE (heat shock protein)|nr:molecular chaperone GrpE [Thermoleophilaceae bacterium]
MSESENPIADIATDGSTIESEAAPELEMVPAAESVDAREAPDPVLAVLERFDDRLEESQRLLARQSEIATSLHAENQRLKAGELRRALLPIVHDVVRVHDVLQQILDAEGADTVAEQQDQHPLRVAVESIRDALARNGIEVMPVTAGAALDARQHKVVGVAAIDDAAAHRTIADVVKIGFAWEDGTAIRAANVRVYKHLPSPQPDGLPEVAPEAAPEAQP